MILCSIDIGHFCDSVTLFATLFRAGGVTKIKTGDRNVKSSQVKSSQVKSKILAAVLGLGLISSVAQAQVAASATWEVWDAGMGTYIVEDVSAAITGNGFAHAPSPSKGYTVYDLALPNTININGDDLFLEARVKNPASEGGWSAYDLYMNATGRTSGLSTALGIFSSGGWGGLRAGTTTVSPGLVLDMQNWHTVGIQTQGGTMSVFYDNAVVSSFAYQSLIGELGDLQVAFKGTGTIDWVNVSSNGNLVLQSDMNSPTVTAVPEPETYAMLLAGLGILGAASRRKRQQTVNV